MAGSVDGISCLDGKSEAKWDERFRGWGYMNPMSYIEKNSMLATMLSLQEP